MICVIIWGAHLKIVTHPLHVKEPDEQGTVTKWDVPESAEG